MIFIKIHKSYRNVVAVCDAELIGKKFEESKFQLDLKESFFKGEKIDGEKLEKMMKILSKEDATFNIVGEKSLEIAKKISLIEPGAIKKIGGVPFSLVLI